MYFLLIWCEICCCFYHPSAGKLSHFKTSISTSPPTFCCTGLPPWGSIISLSLGKWKQRRIQQSYFAWKWKQLSWKARPTTAVNCWEYLFSDTLSESSLKKSDFGKFYKYTGIAVKNILLRNAVFVMLLHLIQFCFWNKTMFSTWTFITNMSMILLPVSIKKKSCFLSGMEDILKN